MVHGAKIAQETLEIDEAAGRGVFGALPVG